MLWTLWMLIRVNQLDYTSQTFTTNVFIGGFDVTTVHIRLPWPASRN